jgi:hypothetical protein
MLALVLLCAAMSSTATASGWTPIGTAQVSQWTVDALFQRFFYSEWTAAANATAASTLSSWSTNFGVSFSESCGHNDWGAAVELAGQTTLQSTQLALDKPKVAVLPNAAIGLSGAGRGVVTGVANAWFIEGVCFGTDCMCELMPVWTLCNASTVTMAFTVEYALEVSIAPDEDGFLPLRTVRRYADVAVQYTSDCYSDQAGATLPEFALKFNETFSSATRTNFTVLAGELQVAIEASLDAFVIDSVRPAMERYFPSRVSGPVGLESRYRVDGASTVSRSTPSYVDDEASLTWNISAAFEATGVDGVRRDFHPTPVQVDAADLNATLIATRLTISPQFVQAAAWYAATRAALTQAVNNTILDATIDSSMLLRTPKTKLLEALAQAPVISPDVVDVENALLGYLPYANGGDVLHSLLWSVATGQANMTCREGAMVLVQASLRNVMVRADVAWQIDPSNTVFVGTSSSLEPQAVPSLFIWSANFDGFTTAKFDIERPTGGFPKVTLVSMMEKALTEALPQINVAFRKHRLPLPPAAALLLNPGSSVSQQPNATIEQGRFGFHLNLLLPRPGSPLPPPPPRSLPHEVAAYVTTDSRTSCGARPAGPWSMKQNVERISTMCAPLSMSPNGTMWFGQITQYDAASSRPVSAAMLCDPGCYSCNTPAMAFTLNADGSLTACAFSTALQGTLTVTVAPLETENPACIPAAMRGAVSQAAFAITNTGCGVAPGAAVAYNFFSVPDGDATACLTLPATSAVGVVDSSGTFTYPCEWCPTAAYQMLTACPSNATVPLPMTSVCISDNWWLGRLDQVPACSFLRFALPTRGRRFDVAVWVPVILCCIALLAAAVALGRWWRRRNNTHAEATSLLVPDNHHSAADVGTRDGLNASNVLPAAGTPEPGPCQLWAGGRFATASLACVSGLMLSGSAVFFAAPPFSGFTTAQAHQSGLPGAMNFDMLHENLLAWTTTVAVCLAVGSGSCAAGVAGVFALRKRGSGKHAVTFVFLGAAALAVILQFGVFSPALRMDARGMVTLALNASVNSLLSNHEIDKVASEVASVAATLTLLPQILYLACAFISALPCALGSGAAIRLLIAERRAVAELANGVTQADGTCWPPGTEVRTSAVPPAWRMVTSLACTTLFCTSMVLSFIGFQATREVAYLVLGVLRAAVGLIPLRSTSLLVDAAEDETNVSARKSGLRGAALLLSLDCALTVAMAAVSTTLASGASVTIHFAALGGQMTLFAYMDLETPQDAWELDETETPALVVKVTTLARRVEKWSQPWWRLPCLVIAVIFIILTFAAHVEGAKNDSLRSNLISYLEESGIQFPPNISSVHLFVDPGIEAYESATRADLVPMAFGLATALVALGAALAAGVVKRETHRVTALRVSRASSITSYFLLLVTAVYFTIPDFVVASRLGDIVPDCAPEFFRQGELLVHTLARVFFSSVVFGRLMPLLVTFPPAVVRVQCFIADRFGMQDHVVPMFIASVVSGIAIQLPLLMLALAAHEASVVGLAAAIPAILFCCVPVFRREAWRNRTLRHVWLIAALILWWLVYFGGWILLIWRAIVADEQVWAVAKRLFESKSLWFEMVSNFFLATVAFCDVCLSYRAGKRSTADDSE